MDIKDTDGIPNYIDIFIKSNMQQLLEIHDNSIVQDGEGFLVFNCNKNENKMDVFFMNKETISNNYSNINYQEIKNRAEGKRIFLINDIELKLYFLLYL
jgi:hypothetical protein